MDKVQQSNLEKRVHEIEVRNVRVEADKAWEISGARKVVIFVVTYIIAAIWLVLIEDTNPYLKALVPALGWYLSTLTIPFIKKYWIKKYHG
jgi:hypothetical protein